MYDKDKYKIINEILKELINKDCYLNNETIKDFLYEIKDITVLGDILSDLK